MLMSNDTPPPPESLAEVLRLGRERPAPSGPPALDQEAARRFEESLTAAQLRMAELEAQVLSLEERNRALEQEKLALEEENKTLKAQAAHVTVEATRLRRDVDQKDAEQRIDSASLQFLLRRLAQCHKELAAGDDAQQVALFEEAISGISREIDRKNKELFRRSSERTRRPPKVKEEGEETKARRGRTDQPNLEKTSQLHLLEAADQICPCCGDRLIPFVGQTEDSERIVVIERKYQLVLDQRQKYVCTACKGVVETALGPDKATPGGRYDLGFIASVAADKYDGAKPLNAQADEMGRKGLDVGTNTLFKQLYHGALLLQPTWRALISELLDDADIVHMDESRWRFMKPGESKGWWIWTVVTATAVFFEIVPTRSAEMIAQMLDGWAGTVVCDAAGAYKRAERLGGQEVRESAGEKLSQWLKLFPPGTVVPAIWPLIKLAYCWSHARREVHLAVPNFPAAEDALHLINRLFVIETEVREAELPDEDARRALRQLRRDTESRKVIDDLKRWMDEQKPISGTQLEAAIRYLRNQWDGLLVFLDDADVPLENNAAERGVRKPVLGRKNHYGSRSERGVWVAALYYSLCGTCRLLGLDARAYLHEALIRAARNRGEAFLPSDYKKELDEQKQSIAA